MEEMMEETMFRSSYWHWISSAGRGGEEDMILCEICLERFGPIGEFWTVDYLNERIQDHISQDHPTVTDEDRDAQVSVWTIREREVIGYQYSSQSRDCDGPHEFYAARRLPEGMTWSHYVGREMTNWGPSDVHISKEGLMLEWGGPTDEGSSHSYLEAIFAHEEYKLDEPDRQRDVFAEQMGY
jgi:hypothetical protein